MVQQEENHKKVKIGRDHKHDQVMAFAVNVKGETYGGDKVSCTYYEKIGHEESSCFELIGYPSGWNSRGERNGCGRGRNSQGGRSAGSRGRGTYAASKCTTYS